MSLTALFALYSNFTVKDCPSIPICSCRLHNKAQSVVGRYQQLQVEMNRVCFSVDPCLHACCQSRSLQYQSRLCQGSDGSVLTPEHSQTASMLISAALRICMSLPGILARC